MISLARLKTLLSYDPLTGIFIRLSIGTEANQRYVDEIAGYVSARGYIHICVDGKTYGGHRLAWFYVTGAWPEFQIDHENNNRSDNRFINLRNATAFQNAHNRGKLSTNTSGYKGVSKYKKKWRASITVSKKWMYLGDFDTKEEAFAVYADAASKHHKEFAKVYDL